MAARQGLLAPSFDQAAGAFSDAVGRAISGDSVGRITEGFARTVEAQRVAGAATATALAQREEVDVAARVTPVAPIPGQANLSTDGAMVLIRAEGWKEVKLVAVSAVTVKEAGERAAKQGRPSRRAQDPLVELSAHSYQAGLWDAATLGAHQYVEGLRRGLEQCAPLSSVNDGAVWIERVTATNFPQAVQIIDWSHPDERLRTVGQAVFGEGSAAGAAWVQARLDQLWAGDTAEVIRALEAVVTTAARGGAEAQEAVVYFRNNQGRMRYPEYRTAGYPIGSGTVESAARTVVHGRMKRPGRGWKRTNGQGMLAALSELHSGRFDDAWRQSLPAVA